MKSYPELMTEFYDDFPEAMGFVTFRHGKLKYPDVNNAALNKTVKRLKLSGNIALHDTWDKVFADYVSGSIVATSGDEAFTRQAANIFNQIAMLKMAPMEQEFIFHHEAYHALQQAWTGQVREGFENAFLEECGADAYAALRLIKDHGNNAVPLLRLISDARIVAFKDTVHLTTFTMDKAIEAGLGLHMLDMMDDMDGNALASLSMELSAHDDFYGIISNRAFYRANNFQHWVDTMPASLVMDTHHPDWLGVRLKQALINRAPMPMGEILRDIAEGVKSKWLNGHDNQEQGDRIPAQGPQLK